MKIFKPNLQDVEDHKCPFGNHYQSDQGILYHGTTNLVESQIETDGFTPDCNFVCKDDILEICKVFARLHFAGEGEGYEVLASYSLNRMESNDIDFISTHFATHSEVYRYTLPHIAGGETIAAIVEAKRELDLFLNDSGARKEFLKGRYAKEKKKINGGTDLPGFPEIDSDCVTYENINELLEFYHQVWRENGVESLSPSATLSNYLEWLSEQMLILKPTFDKCEDLQKRYKYGVVYAIRPIDGDVEPIDTGSLEMKSLKIIPPARIVGKAVINWNN
jgi:hypothetical protein